MVARRVGFGLFNRVTVRAFEEEPVAMKLLYSVSSPYVRKVIVAARELDIFEGLELIDGATSPTATNPAVVEQNPLGKIPALVLDDGRVLFDSRVIAEYFDTLAGGSRLFPAGQARWDAITLQALADGMTDAALLARYEGFLRPEDKRWEDWTAGQLGKIKACLDRLEQDWAGYLSGGIDIGCIATGCALGYLDFRFPHLEWQRTHSELSAWFQEFGARPSMQATLPEG
jgi:glutathione S-transferase